MYQANTIGIAEGAAINAGRGTRTNTEQLWRTAFRKLGRGRRRFAAIGRLFRQITADPQPNSAYYLGTYVPFLDTTQPGYSGIRNSDPPESFL